MLVYVYVDKSFNHPQVNREVFTLDVDATEPVENLKVCSLRYF